MSEATQPVGNRNRWLWAGVVLAGLLLVSSMWGAAGPPKALRRQAEPEAHGAKAPHAEKAPRPQAKGLFTLMHRMLDVLEDSAAKDSAEPPHLEPVMDEMMKVQRQQMEQFRKMAPAQPAAPPLGVKADRPGVGLDVPFGPRAGRIGPRGPLGPGRP